MYTRFCPKKHRGIYSVLSIALYLVAKFVDNAYKLLSVIGHWFFTGIQYSMFSIQYSVFSIQ